MDIESQIVSLAVRALLRLWQSGSWGGLFAAIVIWRQYRRIRYLKEACRRANERRLTELNAMQTRLLETFANAPPPRLADLASDTGRDFRLR
jgi:hypothetical protein